MPIHAYPYNAEEILQYKAGQISLISSHFIEILPFLKSFQAIKGVPHEITNCFFFIILLQLYIADMTLQSNFDTINFNL